MSRYPVPVFGWQAWRLSDHSFEDLNALRLIVESEGANPAHAAGNSIYLYTPEARRKLDALAWAVSVKLKEKRG